MRRLGAITVLVVLVLAGAGCTKESSRAAGRLTVDGRAEVVTSDGDRAVVTRARTLRSGDQVSMLEGTSVLGLGGGRQLELRKDSVVRLGAAPAAGGSAEPEPRGELVSGDVLVVSTDEAATVLVGSTTVQVQGAARVSRGLAVVAAVYEGAAGVETAGRSESVPALKQVTVPAPGLPSRPSPLQASPTDSWDQRYLGDAIELGNQLVARSKGFSAQLAAGEGTTVGFFRQLLPDLAGQPFDASLLDPERAPGETLVGAAITLAGNKDTFVARWAGVFAFHADGAPWGLVALDQNANRSSVLSLVDGAIARRAGPSQQAAPAVSSPTTVPTGRIPVPVPTTRAPSTTPTTAPSTTPTTVATTGTETGSGGSGTGAGPAGGTTGGSVPGSDRGPVDLGLPLVDDTLNGLIDALSGLLGSLGK
ncbi:MAG: hypothetical protein ACRD2W_17820 [Acidimicrobiales bacterium]